MNGVREKKKCFAHRNRVNLVVTVILPFYARSTRRFDGSAVDPNKHRKGDVLVIGSKIIIQLRQNHFRPVTRQEGK